MARLNLVNFVGLNFAHEKERSMTQEYNQIALGRLAAALLRRARPSSEEEGRSSLLGALGAYAPDRAQIDLAVSEHFRRA
jgi:hypothetical protein